MLEGALIAEAENSLKDAIIAQRTDIVRTVLSACDSGETPDELTCDRLLNSISCEEGTVLHMATKLGDPDIVRTLLSSGADPSIRNSSDQTPLDLAKDNLQILTVYTSELFQSIAQSNCDKVQKFLNMGFNMNTVDSEETKSSPLHWAASYGNEDMVQLLLGQASSVNMTNADGMTPLHDAVLRGNPRIVSLLLQHGASTEMKPMKGKYKDKSISDMAEGKTDVEMVLLSGENETEQKPQLVTVPDENGHTRRDSESSLASKEPQSPLSKGPVLNGPLTPGLVKQGGLDHPQQGKTIATKLSSPPQPLDTDSRLHYLWPRPQKLLHTDGDPFSVPETLHVFLTAQSGTALVSDMLEVWQGRQQVLQAMGIKLHLEPIPAGSLKNIQDLQCVQCQVNRRLFQRDESYRISITSKQIRIVSSDRAGMFYATCTIIQLLQLCKSEGIPAITIQDWPCFKDRGILLDLSQGRKPTLDNLKTTVETLAQLKINQVHLYARFSVPEEPHWQFCYQRSELLSLDMFCRKHCISLLPVLDVVPKVSYEDLKQLHATFQDFLACFSSAKVVHLGPRLTSFFPDTASEEELIDSVDTSLLLPIPTDYMIQMCAYGFHEAPVSLQRLPGNIVLMEYGFQASYSFRHFCKPYADSGVPFYVCPGTSAWNSLAGCPEASVSNVYHASHSCLTQGALGLVVCDWSGVGHMTHKCFSWPGFLTGAGLSWNSTTPWDYLHCNLAELLNHHVFYDEGHVTGEVLIELGRAETFVLRCARNQPGTDNSNLPAEHGSTLYKFLTQPDHVDLEHLNLETLQKAMRHIRKCQNELQKAVVHRHNARQVVAELQLTADLQLAACRIGRALVSVGRNPNTQSPGGAGYSVINLGIANLTPTAKTDLANRLLGMLEQYRVVWYMGNIPHGLNESLNVLSTMLKQYLPEETLSSD